MQILIEKNIYYHIFEINEVAGVITAKLVREDLIYRIEHHEKKNETHIYGNDDVKSSMYRNNTGYTAKIDNGTINTLIAHYYFNC